MKIDKTTPPLPTSQIGEAAPRSPNAKPTTGTISNDTSVHLGKTSAQLRTLESSIANSPAIDAEKVKAIKQAISEGRFHVDNGKIADRLIDSVKELISANKGSEA
jgi:negative regulator of flagellin synthesis FlgM